MHPYYEEPALPRRTHNPRPRPSSHHYSRAQRPDAAPRPRETRSAWGARKQARDAGHDSASQAWPGWSPASARPRENARDAGQGYDPNDYPNYPYSPQDRPARDQWSRHWESNPHVEDFRQASHLPQSRPWYPQPIPSHYPEPRWSPYSNSSQPRYPQSTPVTSPWWLPPYPPNTSLQASSGPPFPFNPVNMSPEDWPPADMASAPISHPLLHPAYSNPPTINWNMMVFPRGLHRFSQRGVEVPLTDKDMKKIASNPPTKKMRIGIADTPWAELTISKRKDITLKDVLEVLWDHLNVPMTPGEYNLLDKSKQARVRVAYQARCQLGYFGLPEHERRSGFRRIDWFEGRCGFGGLEWAHINAVGEMCGTMRPRACPPPEA